VGRVAGQLEQRLRPLALPGAYNIAEVEGRPLELRVVKLDVVCDLVCVRLDLGRIVQVYRAVRTCKGPPALRPDQLDAAAPEKAFS
jgi:hypothetical protein